jgi:hypothetical protein
MLVAAGADCGTLNNFKYIPFEEAYANQVLPRRNVLQLLNPQNSDFREVEADNKFAREKGLITRSRVEQAKP